ncbi:MAG TPA: M48 family metalloprotease [Balneolaceae bacterium]|nr:M48 family metalloprotease [Balneolaceae bacterium]
MKIQRTRNFMFILLSAFLVSFCVVQRSPVTGDKRAYAYSWEQEKQIGKKADQQIQQQYGVYQGDVVEYVKDVAHKVLAVSHMRREDTPEKYKQTEFHFRVLDSPITNAFALPGGYVYVTRGLLAHLKNEAQLAVVLGHEIGHVAARHASQSALERQIGQLGLIAGAIAGEELLGVPGGAILNLGSLATQYLFLSYSREDERESDKLGVEYAAMQHYEAADGAGFFKALERMSNKSGQSIPTWASTHPDPGERAERIPKLAENWAEKGYEQTVEDTDQYMKEIEGITYGINPRQGFTRDGRFYHPELEFQFQFPRDWQVINQPSMVAVINESQDAVSIMQIDPEAGSPRASVDAFVSQQGFVVQAQGDEQSNGLNGYEAIATARTQQGVPYKFYIYAVEYGDMVYRFTSYSVAEKFDQYANQFVAISNSFAELNDEDILDIQPVHLKTLKADHTAPFSDFLPEDSFLPENYPLKITAEEIAILNQVKLDETIEEGTWIKVPAR